MFVNLKVQSKWIEMAFRVMRERTTSRRRRKMKDPSPEELFEQVMKDNKSQQPDIPDERYHWRRLKDYLWKHIGDERFINGWLAFYDIVESPWWKRAWVFQEFIASSTVSLLYWRSSLSWSHVSPILRSFCFAHMSVLTNRDFFLGLTDFKPGGPQDRQMCRIIDRIERTNSEAALDMVYFMVKAKIEGVVGFMDLKKLLAHSRYCKASDDRDRVFAFLGLADPGYGINTNYSTQHDISTVLIETTMRILLFENGLDVLRHAATPDFSVRVAAFLGCGLDL